MGTTGTILLALSLCADCFAVSLCSSVTLGRFDWGRVLRVALVFAVIQAGLLMAGWGLGELLTGLLGKAARLVAFALLCYVAVSMIVEALKAEGEVRDLGTMRNIILGGIATSVDAAIVGAARSMDGVSLDGILPLFAEVFAFTLLSVVLGMGGGSRLGVKYGKAADILGGLILLAIAFWNLFR